MKVWVEPKHRSKKMKAKNSESHESIRRKRTGRKRGIQKCNLKRKTSPPELHRRRFPAAARGGTRRRAAFGKEERKGKGREKGEGLT